MIRALLVRLFRGLIRLYFRSIEELGARPSPVTASRLFVANHQNALIDPILVITSAPCPISPVAKSTLWDIPGLRWLLDRAEAVPIVRKRDDPNKRADDNDAVFERVGSFLSAGGNLLIFPEGTSHNEPHLQRLRTGAARMLARAAAHRAAHPDAPAPAPLTFQAVALEFEARDTFRSRCVLSYGPVRTMDDFDDAEPRPEPADDPATSEAVIQAITDRMREDLSSLLVEGESWTERRLMFRVAELVRNESGRRTFADLAAIGQAVRRARDELAVEPSRVEPVARAVNAYFDRLESAGLRDELFVRDPADGPGMDLAALVRRALFPVAALGVLLYFLPYQLPRIVARRDQHADMQSTLKLGVGMALFPLWAIGLCVACARWIPAPWWALAVVLAVLSPFVALDRLEHEGSFSRAFVLLKRHADLVTLARLRAAALDAISAVEPAAISAATPQA